MLTLILISFFSYSLFCENFTSQTNSFHKSAYTNIVSQNIVGQNNLIPSYSSFNSYYQKYYNQITYLPYLWLMTIFMTKNGTYLYKIEKQKTNKKNFLILILIIFYITFCVLMYLKFEYLDYFSNKKVLWKKDFILEEVIQNINENPIFQEFINKKDNMLNVNLKNLSIIDVNNLFQNLSEKNNLAYIINNNLEIHIWFSKNRKIIFLRNKAFLTSLEFLYKHTLLNFHIEEYFSFNGFSRNNQNNSINGSVNYYNLLYLNKFLPVDGKKINLYILNDTYNGISDNLLNTIGYLKKNIINIEKRI
jgi:hypothetical protein